MVYLGVAEVVRGCSRMNFLPSCSLCPIQPPSVLLLKECQILLKNWIYVPFSRVRTFVIAPQADLAGPNGPQIRVQELKEAISWEPATKAFLHGEADDFSSRFPLFS